MLAAAGVADETQQKLLVVSEDQRRTGAVAERGDHEIERLTAFRAAVDHIAEKDDASGLATGCGIGVDRRQKRFQQVASAVDIADGIEEGHACSFGRFVAGPV